jgi:hypothetical protein
MRILGRLVFAGLVASAAPALATAAMLGYTADEYSATVTTNQAGTSVRSGSLVDTGGFRFTIGMAGPTSGSGEVWFRRLSPVTFDVSTAAAAGPDGSATSGFQWLLEFSVAGTDAIWRADVGGRPDPYALLTDLTAGASVRASPSNSPVAVSLLDGHRYRLEMNVGAFQYSGSATGAGGGTVSFENATFVRIPEPGTLWLAGAALLAFAGGLRPRARNAAGRPDWRRPAAPSGGARRTASQRCASAAGRGR